MTAKVIRQLRVTLDSIYNLHGVFIYFYFYLCVSGQIQVYKPGLDHFSPICFQPPFPLSNASLGHYIGPIGEGEEMQRSSQTDSPEGTLCCIFCDFRDYDKYLELCIQAKIQAKSDDCATLRINYI